MSELNEPAMEEHKASLNFRWLLLMAWRDSRRNRSRLFLFISSIILGIAALVAIYSFEYNLRRDIDSQAKSLLGADLIIETNKTVKEESLPMLKSLGTERSEERTFASMVYFQKNGGTRLVNVRALSGDFPYYGDIETSPKSASRSFRIGKQALVDKTLMLQYDAKPGDSIKVGEVIFEIAGVLNKAPGQTGFNAAVAPIVYIPLSYLEETGLSQKGSRITYNFYYKFPPETNVNKLAKRLESKLEKAELDYETIESRKENTGRSFEDMTEFLALVGFIALLLGCIGVASAIHIYIREKINTIAVLRCLGASSRQAFLIYLIQIAGIGLIGSLIGAILGTLIQQFLPIVLKDFLPVEITVAISWMAVGQGLLLGLITLHGGALRNLVGPADDVGVFVHRQKFARLVSQPFDRGAVPGPGGDVGNGIVVTGQVAALGQAAVEHVELPLHFHRKAVDGVLHFAGRIGVKVAKATTQVGRAAHLPEQPVHALDLLWPGGQKRTKFLGQVQQDGA
jgi:putative ABC transport system permease protein